MINRILIWVLLFLMYGCGSPRIPCDASSTCVYDAGPADWKDFARRTFVYYDNARSRSAGEPPYSAVRWIAVGDCPGQPNFMKGVNDNPCVDGTTLVTLTPSGPRVDDLVVMVAARHNGSFQHELLHAWLALSRTVDDGDPDHAHVVWTYLPQAAMRDVE